MASLSPSSNSSLSALSVASSLLTAHKLPPHGVAPSQLPIPKPLLTLAPVQEVFSSIQGEGPWVGVRQAFIRFAHCHLQCAYCDTPMTTPTGQAVWEPIPGSHGWHPIETQDEHHRLSVADVVSLVLALEQQAPLHSVSLTGGEPLLQTPFLTQLLPALQGHGLATYLETSGTQPHFLAQVMPWVTYVSMDCKLPSSTQQSPKWEAHTQFYSTARQHLPMDSVWLKCVINPSTTVEELAQLCQVTENERPLVLLQPQSAIRPKEAVQLSAQQLLTLEASLSRLGYTVRVIPQLHKYLELS